MSFKKIKKEARSAEPDLRRVIGCSSLQHMAADAVHDDLQHRLDIFENKYPVQSFRKPSRNGYSMHADYYYDSQSSSSTEWDKQSLRQALWELEQVNRKGEMARAICFQIIGAD